MKPLYLALLAPLALAACATEATEAVKPAETVRYACEDDSKVTARFDGLNAVVNAPDGKTVTLPQYYNAGVNRWYTQGAYDLRVISETRALWSMGRNATAACERVSS